jgi:hypothetical protein
VEAEIRALRALHTDLALALVAELSGLLADARVASEDGLQALLARHAEDPAAASSPEARLVASHQALLGVLARSRCYVADTVLARLPDDVLLGARAEALHALGRRREVVELCVRRGDHASAEAYCVRVHEEAGDNSAFRLLLRLYLEQCAHDDDQSLDAAHPHSPRDPRADAPTEILVAGASAPSIPAPRAPAPAPAPALTVNRRLMAHSTRTTTANTAVPVRTLTGATAIGNVHASSKLSATPAAAAAQAPEEPAGALSSSMTAALSLLARHPYAVDVPTAIQLIPAAVRLHQVQPFLRTIVAQTTQKLRQGQVEKALMRFETLRARDELLAAYRQHVVVDADTACTACGKKLGLAAFAATSDGKLFHYVCYANSEAEVGR